jgi:hypothetical protein
VSRTTDSILENASKSSLTRYRAGVIIPSKVKSEIAVLKGIVASQVMTHNSRQSYYEDQRELLIELAEALLSSGSEHLDSISAEAWSRASSDQAAITRSVQVRVPAQQRLGVGVEPRDVISGRTQEVIERVSVLPPLDDAAVMGMRLGVAHYVENAKAHAAAATSA